MSPIEEVPRLFFFKQNIKLQNSHYI